MHDLIEKHLTRVKGMRADAKYNTYKTNLKQTDA